MTAEIATYEFPFGVKAKGVNWDHPLADGLVFATDGSYDVKNNSIRELISDFSNTVGSSGHKQARLGNLYPFDWPDEAAYFADRCNLNFGAVANGGNGHRSFSAAFQFLIAGTVAGDLAQCGGNGVYTYGWHVRLNSRVPEFYEGFAGGPNNVISSFGALTLETVNTVIITYTEFMSGASNKVGKLYVNGAFAGQMTNVQLNYQAAGESFKLGAGITNRSKCIIGPSMVWSDRVLSDGEVAEWNWHPGALLEVE